MSPRDAFTRALRRHEERARAMGANAPANHIRRARVSGHFIDFKRSAAERRECRTQWDNRIAFIYECVAKSVEKFRAAGGEP